MIECLFSDIFSILKKKKIPLSSLPLTLLLNFFQQLKNTLVPTKNKKQNKTIDKIQWKNLFFFFGLQF